MLAGDVGEILELARQAIACVNRGDDEGLAALMADDVKCFPYVAAGEYVVISGRTVARGRGSGVEVASDDAWVIRFRDGEAIEYRECETRQEALQVVGLSQYG